MKKTLFLIFGGMIIIILLVVLSFMFLNKNDNSDIQPDHNYETPIENQDKLDVEVEKNTGPDFIDKRTGLTIDLPENWPTDYQGLYELKYVNNESDAISTIVANYLDKSEKESLLFTLSIYPTDIGMAVLDKQPNTEIVALNLYYILTISRPLDMPYEPETEDFKVYSSMINDTYSILENIKFGDNYFVNNAQINKQNDNKTWEVTVNYPQLHDKERFSKINKLIAKEINKTVDAFIDNVIDWEKELLEPGQNISTLWINYELKEFTPKYLSIKYTNSTYFAGAAHPNTFSTVFNYDIVNDKVLEVTDLFPEAEEKEFLPIIAKLTREKLIKQLDVDQKEFDNMIFQEGLEPKIENFNNFNITVDGYIFNFPPYQLASYAAGEFMVLFTYDELQENFDISPFIYLNQ